jgi:3-oxoacyl-[acyl-carrier-protein] synthase II
VKRVVITGVGLLTPIGNDCETVAAALRTGKSGVGRMPEWQSVRGLKTFVAGRVTTPAPKKIPRSNRRTMGRVALLGAFAAISAASDARLDAGTLASGRVGLSMGSTIGSAHELEYFYDQYLPDRAIETLEGTLFMKIMSHTVAANAAATLGIRGRVSAPCAACASSTQAIGQGFEAIRSGAQDVMLCGGAEEIHPTAAGVFDVLAAASRGFNDEPDLTPRPFDSRRDGLVLSEGAAVVVLEELDSAKSRGARIYGEVLGYAANADTQNMALSDVEGMAECMREALDSAGARAGAVDYINAHATGTLLGDAVEAEAMRRIFSNDVPVSSTKGHTGHTLGACGAMETAFCLAMMEKGFLAPTRNLDEVDPQCAGLAHVREVVAASPEIVLTNNFAFGGINASIVLGAMSRG